MKKTLFLILFTMVRLTYAEYWYDDHSKRYQCCAQNDNKCLLIDLTRFSQDLDIHIYRTFLDANYCDKNPIDIELHGPYTVTLKNKMVIDSFFQIREVMEYHQKDPFLSFSLEVIPDQKKINFNLFNDHYQLDCWFLK